VRICGCCIRIRAGISVRVRVRVRDGVRISNRVRRRVKVVNYSLITALPIATSAHPLFTRGLCPLLYDFSISILRKLFINDTSVSSYGNITFMVMIDILHIMACYSTS